VAHRQDQKVTERHGAAAHRASGNGARRQAAPDGGEDFVSKLQGLAELRASGALSEKEFAAAKAKLLR
jgi:hypothetical protein